MATPFNLFNFSNLGGVSSIVQPTQPTQQLGATGGGILPPTPTRQPLPQTPQVIQKPTQNTNIFSIPKASANSSIDTNISQQAISDIHAGMPMSEFDKTYPELSQNKGLFEQYASDVTAGMPQSEGAKNYPELFGNTTTAPNEVPKEKPGQNMATDIMGGGSNAIYSGIGNILDMGASVVNPVFNKIDEFTGNKPSPLPTDLGKKMGDWSNQQQGPSFNPESKSAFTGEMIGSIAALVSMPTASLEKGIAELGARYTPQVAVDIIANAAKTYPKLAKYVSYFGQGVIPSAQYQAISEGNLNPKDIAINSAILPSAVAIKDLTVGGTKAVLNPVINTAKKYFGTPEEIGAIQTAIKPRITVKNGVITRTQEQIDKEISLTNSLIRQSGEKPTNLAEYKDSIKTQMKNIGDEISRTTKQDLSIDLSDTAGKVEQLAQSKAVKILDPSEGNKLMQIAEDLRKGRITVEEGESMNQWINDVVKNQSSASETYKKGLGIIVQDIRTKLDEVISNIPGQFKELKTTYGALRNIYGDTARREIVYNRQNPEGLITSISKIEGFGNIASGIFKTITLDFKGGATDIAKGVTQNRVGNFIKTKNDPNNLIRSIFSNPPKNGNTVTPRIPITNKSSIGLTENQGKVVQPRKLINIAEEKSKAGIITKPKPKK